MLPVHEEELLEDTQGKDPVMPGAGALVLSSESDSCCLSGQESKKGEGKYKA